MITGYPSLLSQLRRNPPAVPGRLPLGGLRGVQLLKLVLQPGSAPLTLRKLSAHMIEIEPKSNLWLFIYSRH
jgi:hypothetical protein